MKLLNHTLSYLSIAFFVVIGVWATFLYFNLLDEIYDSIDDGLENSKILIINKARTDSTVLYKTNFLESNYSVHEIPGERALRFRDVYTDSLMYMLNEKDYEPVRILKTAFQAENGRYYQLDIVSSMVEEDDLIADLLYSIIVLYVILLVSILLINNFLLRRIWKPFYEIVDHLKRFKLDSPESPPASATNVSEFKALHGSVTALIDRSVATFQNQKQFIENASHELQTPLAISINKLELLAERETLPEAEMQEIATVIQSLERLTRLNKTLLLLSKIENRQFPERSAIDSNELINAVVSELSDLADYKSVTITREFAGALTLSMNAELASAMISNLVKNAIIHNVEGGTVTIRVDAESITVVNTGTSDPMDGRQVFTRFYKSGTSKASTGLGLAIVKSIADYYGYDVRYSFNGQHSFTISVPAQ